MHILLNDAVCPNEGGESTHVSFEHALVHRKLQFLVGQDNRILVFINACVVVDVVCIEMLMLLQQRAFDGFLESLIYLEIVAGTFRVGFVRGFVINVPYLFIFVRLAVVVFPH